MGTLEQLGVDVSGRFPEEHKLFINLQSAEFVEEKIKEIQAAGQSAAVKETRAPRKKRGQQEESKDDSGSGMYNLLAMSNLDDQLKLLMGRGFTEEDGGGPGRKREVIANFNKAQR